MPRLPLLGLLACLAGCGFNAAYTADRRMADADRAVLAGDSIAARAAWEAAIGAAAAGYRARSHGSRADHALLVVAAARLALGQPAEAAAAARYLLATSPDGPDAPAGRAWLGAALVRLDSASAALVQLDEALAEARMDQRTRAVAALHRAEARLALGHFDAAAQDAAAAMEHPATASAAWHLAQQLAVASALREARQIVNEAGSLHALAGVHPILEDHVDADDVGRLLRSLRAVERLALQARPGDMLPLFAAAEVARDDLEAPNLAAALFLSFARAAADTPWSGKAVLAAHVLLPSPETRMLLASHAANIYVRAAAGDPVGDELTLAEERLARRLLGLRDAALREGSPGMTRP
jgi:hypothetical protein